MLVLSAGFINFYYIHLSETYTNHTYIILTNNNYYINYLQNYLVYHYKKAIN